MLPELERLDRYRLEHDRTFAELAEEMHAAGFPVHANTLHLHLRLAPDRDCHDRTVYKIRKFLTLKRVPRVGGIRRARGARVSSGRARVRSNDARG